MDISYCKTLEVLDVSCLNHSSEISLKSQTNSNNVARLKFQCLICDKVALYCSPDASQRYFLTGSPFIICASCLTKNHSTLQNYGQNPIELKCLYCFACQGFVRYVPAVDRKLFEVALCNYESKDDDDSEPDDNYCYYNKAFY